MRRYAVPGLITMIAAALLAVLAFAIANQGTSSAMDALVKRGDYPTAPNLHTPLPVLGSKATRTLASLKGKVVLLNVFASWCEPCQAEAPVLRNAQKMLAAHGGTVVGLTYEDSATNDVKYMRQYHLSYPVLRDVSGNFAHAFGVTGVPETFVINRQGKIAAIRRYQLTQTWVTQTLAKVLKESA